LPQQDGGGGEEVWAVCFPGAASSVLPGFQLLSDAPIVAKIWQ
jgi:hypothetical protein